ncbi:MAG: nuclear transport factor 2 family protein, partial [Candidatus Cloacimonetes bacterium]|nr:nuclear transport factor 2 family protein [Candidatus Cloacimonadota bacterium]
GEMNLSKWNKGKVMRMKKEQVLSSLILVILIGLFVACSEVTKPEAASRIQINQILDDIEDAVFTYDPEKIIDFIHQDFLHNGNDKIDQSYVWQIRLLHFNTMQIDNREIAISQNSAFVSFDMTLIAPDSTVVTEEPSEEYGDISYFIRDEGKWQLYGNQRY